MKFRLEELKKAPLDTFVEVDGSEFPVLLTTDGLMMAYGHPYRVSNTGGFFASAVAVTGGHTGAIVLFMEVLEKISGSSLAAILSHEEAHLKLGHIESANAGSVEMTKNRTMNNLQFEMEADRHSAEKHGSAAVAKALEEVIHITVDAVVPEKTRFRKAVVKILSLMTIHSGPIKKRRKALLA
jgi:Zn-dependent protease with chaperone function